MEPKRLIVFLELVRGCNNSECPSWNVVCKQSDQQYMTSNMLSKISMNIKKTLSTNNPFEIVDFWAYGNGDTLDHPNLVEMLKLLKTELGDYGRISMAIDSRRKMPGHYCKGKIVDHNSPSRWLLKCDTCGALFEGVTSASRGSWVEDNEWWKYLDKIKIIHKLPETFDWVSRAKEWSNIPIKMSHKLITNHLSNDMWKAWKTESFITELKAVPWHNIELGTDNPIFTQRESFTYDKDVPVNYGEYPGLPVRRSLIGYDGSLRRCLVSPTKYKKIKDLFLDGDDVCPKCWPLTGSELAKFYDDRLTITPSANCVSDGYFVPTW